MTLITTRARYVAGPLRRSLHRHPSFLAVLRETIVRARSVPTPSFRRPPTPYDLPCPRRNLPTAVGTNVNEINNTLATMMCALDRESAPAAPAMT